jgi:hypothetical protein
MYVSMHYTIYLYIWLQCIPQGTYYDMADIVTCPDAAAHSAKKMSQLYKGRSGLLRPSGGAPDHSSFDAVALERRMTKSGRARMGSGLLVKLAATRASTTSAAPSSGGGGGGGGGIPTRSSSAPAAAGKAPPRVVVNHFSERDRAWNAEIRRRAEVLVTSGRVANALQPAAAQNGAAPSVPNYIGVSLAANKAADGAPLYTARVSHGGGQMELGSTWRSPVEAAVAVDYAATYLRGSLAGNINFPGSESDCRVEAPLDAWPPDVQVRS